MKIFIVGDLHLCEYSSILRSQDLLYSTRLENCVKTINWCEYTALEQNCDLIVYLGDFFDRADLNAVEITATSHIDWARDIKHFFLVGNHEMGINTLEWNSTSMVSGPNRIIVDNIMAYHSNDVELVFLPYVLEENRQPLEFYTGAIKKVPKRIIFSHNDIAGIQMGQFISQAGFSVDEIEKNCDLFFNGHLHNGVEITDKVINVGNITGQNFSEDGFKYSHKAYILDTDTMRYMPFINPEAINFYKIENLKDLANVNNAVVTVKVTADIAPGLKQQMDNDPNIIASRLIVDYSSTKGEDKDINDLLSVDHLNEFRTFILEEFKDSSNIDLVREELGYIYG